MQLPTSVIQMTRADVKHLDAVVLHIPHKDHIAGLDDIKDI